MAKTRPHNWSEATKAACIAAREAGLTLDTIAETYGVPKTCVHDWTTHPVPEDVVRKAELAKGELADKAERVAHLIIDAAPDKIGDAGLSQSMVSFGIAVDKMRVLREQPSSITEVRAETREEKVQQLRTLSEKHGLRLVVNE